ncbi:hypothetical protein THRCLA_06055 [Thraustotheca clavata]|uniref:Mediator complex subunit 15 KIX domain-containing protein n=1 Tax=Thraustotheca clavata TaxID=74557 RepID=A0A1V9ZQK9_9STRA|nr:hypothetical protein THRCLA_06055 [Thraustotheca clavata]
MIVRSCLKLQEESNNTFNTPTMCQQNMDFHQIEDSSKYWQKIQYKSEEDNCNDAANTPENAHPAMGQESNQMVQDSSKYWRKHAQLKAKYLVKLIKVCEAFDERSIIQNDQNEGKKTILNGLQFCLDVLSEDALTSQVRHFDDLTTVHRYVVKIVYPYLKQLKAGQAITLKQIIIKRFEEQVLLDKFMVDCIRQVRHVHAMNGINMNGMNGNGMNMGSMNGMNASMGSSMSSNMAHHGMNGGMMNPPAGAMHHMNSMNSMNSMNMNMGMGMGMPSANGSNAGGNPTGMTPMGMSMPMQQHHGQSQHHHMLGMQQMNPNMPGMNHNMPGNMNPNMGMHMGQNSNVNSTAPNSMTPSYSMPPSNAPYSSNGMPSSNPPANGQSIANMEWRAQFTREHRANLIAKMYNEMVRVSTDPPGIALWINVAWFELKLYKECQTQEDYINKILKRLQHLKTQAGEMNPNNHAMMPTGPQYMQQQQYGNNMNINTNGPNFSNSGTNSGGPSSANTPKHQPNKPVQQPPKQPMNQMNQGSQPNQAKPPTQLNMMQKPGGNPSPPQGDNSYMNQMANNMPNAPTNTNPAEYWRQHAQLKAKYLADVNTVHSAFKKYVDHMKDQNESEQKKKLTYLLGYVQLCANILSEDASTSPARHLDELEKVNKYVIKIVHPYLKKLKSEKDKRNSASNTPQNAHPSMGQQGMSFEMMMRNSMSGPGNNPNSNNNFTFAMADALTRNRMLTMLTSAFILLFFASTGAVIFLVSSQGHVHASPMPLYTVPTIVLAGDSITQYSANPSVLGYHTLLVQDYVRHADVLNRGFAGWTTKDYLTNAIPPIVAQMKNAPPMLVTILLGSNDAVLPGTYGHADESEYEANLMKIATSFTDAFPNTKLLLITPPPVDDTLQIGQRSNALLSTYVEGCKRVGKQLGIPVLDLYTKFLAQNASSLYLLGDGVHLNADGNRALHDLLLDAITTNYPSLTPYSLPTYFVELS